MNPHSLPSSRSRPRFVQRGFPWFFALFLSWVGVVPGQGAPLLPPSSGLAADPGPVTSRKSKAPAIEVWYGDRQVFGRRGRAQRWVNVLGHVRRPEQVRSLQYQLNGGQPRDLTLGSDQHRLAKNGDFNVELAWEELNTGENTLVLTRKDKNGRQTSSTVTVVVEPERAWPLPYYVNFAKTQRLLEAVQVVDGHWQLTGEGVRTLTPYYDRVLSAGDSTWQNYEATVRLTVHGFTPSAPGPPTYNVTHFGLALRWRGHTADDRQPSRQWYPLGAQGEFLLKDNPSAGQWRILTGGGPTSQKPAVAPGTNALELGKPLLIKGQVQTMPDGRTRYRFRQWMEGTSEPLTWDVEAFEPGDQDYPSGALCLVPHNADVTIHELRVEPLKPLDRELYARPGPGQLHFSAPQGGLYGARGEAFVSDFLPKDARLLALQVSHQHLLKGLRFRVLLADGTEKTVTLGLEEGPWQEWYTLKPGQVLTGISGASGWYLDGIQFHFSDGQSTPNYYTGTGGDTLFRLQLNQPDPAQQAWIRGFFGTFDRSGIETIGLIFDPRD